MNIEDKIAELAALAAPLRLLADDEPTKEQLNPIIVQINELRALQAKGQAEIDGEAPKKRGRPARVEGDNA